MTFGTLYGISVGTGDPELITVKGLRILQQVPIVAFPAGLRGKPGIAETIIKPWLQPQQQTLALSFPYVHEQEDLNTAWKTAASQVWQYLNQGKSIGFACEGDVSFYSTFTYLAQTLEQHYPQVVVERIPGVCSPMASASALKLPLTVRSQGLAVLPALYNLEQLKTILSWADVVVLMKVNTVYEQVWELLEQHQLLERSWVIERATSPQEIIHRDLQHYPKLKLPYFSLLIIHVKD